MTTANELAERETRRVCTGDCMSANGCSGFVPCANCGEPVCGADAFTSEVGKLCEECSGDYHKCHYCGAVCWESHGAVAIASDGIWFCSDDCRELYENEKE